MFKSTTEVSLNVATVFCLMSSSDFKWIVEFFRLGNKKTSLGDRFRA
jgi:hypothetical protein